MNSLEGLKQSLRGLREEQRVPDQLGFVINGSVVASGVVAWWLLDGWLSFVPLLFAAWVAVPMAVNLASRVPGVLD